MGKIIVTQEQADKIKGWEYHTGYPGRLLELHAQYLLTSSKCLQSLSLDELARCLYSEEGYEVEEKFKQHELVIVRQAERVEELEENCSHLRKSFQRQRNKAVEGWEKVIELEKENEHLKQAWEIAKTESLEWGAGRNIPNDDKELAYRIGAQDMHEDFVDYYEKSLEASQDE